MLPFKRSGQGRKRKSPSDIVGLDLGASGIKAVRMRRGKEGLVVLRAEILPYPAGSEATGAAAPLRLTLPRPLQANYTALAISGARASVRILSLPGHLESGPARLEQIRQHIGVDEHHRLGYTVISPPKTRTENRLLVVSLPEEDARAALDSFAVGPPAPFSLEIAGLAALTAFRYGPGRQYEHGGAVGAIESGARLTVMGFFHRGLPVLVRKFDLGLQTVVDRVRQQLNVDAKTAEGLLLDGSFDMSQAIRVTLDPFIRQLSLSKEFVERREECRVEKIYLSGGMSLARFWLRELNQAGVAPMETWNPLEGLARAPDALAAELEHQQTRLAAAVGCCLGTWENA